MRTKKKKLVCILTLGLLMLGANTITYAQKSDRRINHSKALAILQRANVEYKAAGFSVAARDYEQYLTVDNAPPKSVLAKLADCYCQIRANDNALRVYKLLFKNGKEDATEEQKVRVGELYARQGMYKEAASWLQDVSGYEAKVGVYNSSLKLKSLKRDSVNWTVGFLNVNTSFREYCPVLVDSILFFSSNKPLSVQKEVSLWDESCYTRLHKIALRKIKTESINILKERQMLSKNETKVVSKSLAQLYEGADAKDAETKLYFMTDKVYMRDNSKDTLSSLVKGLDKIDFNVTGITFDRNHHVYFSANYPQSGDKINRIRLMEGVYSSNEITDVHALPFGDDGAYSVMLPTVSRDGNTLVFCSDKAGGRGKMDLYYTLRDTKTHKWSEPEAFDWNVNTVGNEVFPSITSDGYLYFSSDARAGLGGLDIYRIPLQDAIEGKEEPEHLSYPINSSADDFGWTQDSTKMTGFFSSDRLNNDDNLYSFQYKDRQRIDSISGSMVGLKTHDSKKVRYISGEIVDAKTNKPIAGATLFILNKRTNKVNIVKTDKNGKYYFIVPSDDKIILKAVKKGLTNDCLVDKGSITLQQKDTILKNVQDLLLEKQLDDSYVHVDLHEGIQSTDTISGVMQNLMLKKHMLKINDSWKLNNIHYSFNKWDIRPDAQPILDSLIMLLKKYSIRVELGSHTDSRGTFEYNDWLSQKRAESAVNYLARHGISRNRITATGYGERALLNHCAGGVPCSEKDHQVNRRTEVRVISNWDIQKYQKDNIDPNKFKAGEQLDKNMLPVDFFDNCDKLNESEDSTSSLENKPTSYLNSEHRFAIQFRAGESNVELQYQYILDALPRVLYDNPSIILQITAQGDDNDQTETLSNLRANSIRKYLVDKGVSPDRCSVNQDKKSKSEVPSRNAVLHVNNVNLDNLLLHSFIQSYKGNSKEMIIRNDNGNYCVQFGAFKTRAKSQQLADKVQSILSVSVSVVEEAAYFKIRTPYSTNKKDAIEIAAIIQASGILYGK